MKYTGSKEKIASDIVSFINSYIVINNIDTYIEPFVGGCNIIDSVQCTNRIASDNNKYVIALFKYLQDNGELPESITSEQYSDCKAHYKAKDKYYPEWYIAAIGYLAGQNGKFFNKSSGNHVYKEEQFADMYQEARSNIINQVKKLSDVQFSVQDYRKINPYNSVIYCDPPYSGSKGIDSITKDFNYIEFWDIMREWSKNNIVLISEEKAPDDFCIIWEQGDSNEKLFIHESLNETITEYDF